MALPPLDPQTRRNLLLGAAVLALVSYGFYSYVYSPRVTEVDALRTRLEELQTRNSSARALTRGVGDDPEGVLAAYRRQLESVEGLIPSGEELPDLLDAISMEAQRSGVEISLIQPSGATEEQYYTRRVYDMAVLGRYHDIGEFLTRVASLPRIVTPKNLVLAPAPATGAQPASAAEPVRLEARFSVETYVIPTNGTTNGPPSE
jgi:type IV pilus assembly protein PilO